MSKAVTLGNVVLETGSMPAICVPVLAYGVSEVMNQARAVVDSPADLTEFRADYLDDSSYYNAYTVKVAMESVKRILPQRPMIFTLRTRKEGGNAVVEEPDYRQICTKAIESGFAEAIDVEFSHQPETVSELIETAHRAGVKVILSRHDFSSTPDTEEMIRQMQAMAETGADIVKMAVMPQDEHDAFRVLMASEELKQSLEIPFILIAMGEKGSLTRLIGERSGSVLTFGTTGIGSAPGQIPADDLDRALRIIHNAGQPVPEKHSKDVPNLILGGFMGVGKSSTALKIARYSDLEVLEMDQMIEEREGMTIPEIFEKHGEAYFRRAEAELCREISENSGMVVSTGGGTLMNPSNVELLKKNGLIFILEASPDVIYERLRNAPEERPLLKDHMNRGYISWLMKQRQKAYRAAADEVLDVSRMTPGSAAVKILSLCGLIPG